MGSYLLTAVLVGRVVQDVGLRPLACWGCGFEFRLGHGGLSLLNVVCCISSGLCDWPIPRPEKSSQVCCVIVCDRCKYNPLHLQ